ncbi:MAG: glycosyltransferase family 2 protein [Infirmifilum sp.]
MKVSIVVPTFNRIKDLAELFDSILNQTILPVEVILVDDTPSDEVKLLCEGRKSDFLAKGIKLLYLRNPKNRSAATARNVGAEFATGDILLFLDSDVILLPNYVEEILRVFKEKPDAVGVSGYMVNVAESAQRDRLLRMKNIFRRIFRYGYRHIPNKCGLGEYPVPLTRVIPCQWLSGSNVAYKREVFLNFRFDENLGDYSYMEDLLLSYTIYKAYQGGLYITPSAKCVHKQSPKPSYNIALDKHKNTCRKYVLRKLFGWRGLLLYYWQNIGMYLAVFLDRLG